MKLFIPERPLALSVYSKYFQNPSLRNNVILRKLSKEFRPETRSQISKRKVIIRATSQRRYIVVIVIK